MAIQPKTAKDYAILQALANSINKPHHSGNVGMSVNEVAGAGRKGFSDCSFAGTRGEKFSPSAKQRMEQQHSQQADNYRKSYIKAHGEKAWLERVKKSQGPTHKGWNKP